MKCDHPGCSGGHWKLDDCLSDALWSAGPDFWDESGGNSGEYGAYCALILANEDFVISADHWGGGFYITIPAGTFVLLTEVSSGRVYTNWFTSDTDAQDAYDAHDKAYGIWREANGY